MKIPFRLKLEFEFKLCSGSLSTVSDLTDCSFSIVSPTDPLDLPEEIKPPELDDDIDPDTKTTETPKIDADEFLAAKAEEENNPPTSPSTSSSDTPCTGDTFNSSNLNSIDLSFLSLKRPKEVNEKIIDKVLDQTSEIFVYSPDIIAARERLATAKSNGTLEQELAILNNSDKNSLSEKDQKFVESFNTLYDDASGYTGIKAASSVWEDIATKTTFYSVGSDTIISNTDPETGYNMFPDSFIPEGALSEIGSLWRLDEKGRFIFYDEKKDCGRYPLN